MRVGRARGLRHGVRASFVVVVVVVAVAVARLGLSGCQGAAFAVVLAAVLGARQVFEGLRDPSEGLVSRQCTVLNDAFRRTSRHGVPCWLRRYSRLRR